MKIGHKILLTIFVLALALITLIATEKPVYAGFWTDAYKVQVAYYQYGIPHYGAYFADAHGSQQYFTGPSGQPSGYSSWNWWGQDLGVLLVYTQINLKPIVFHNQGRGQI